MLIIQLYNSSLELGHSTYIKFSRNCDNEGVLTRMNYINISNVLIKIFLTVLVKYFTFLLSDPYKENSSFYSA